MSQRGIARVIGVGASLLLAACGLEEISQASEPALPEEAMGHPLIQYQCYFFEVNESFLRKEVGQERSERKIYSRTEGDRLVKKLQARGNSKFTSTPAVTCRDGKKGKMELYREFVYAAEYSPPEIPHQKEQVDGVFPVTPSTPSAFEMRKVGLEANFQGKKKPGGVVEFDYEVKRTDFLGFINYGSPITAPAKGLFGKPTDVVITENRIEMPVFDVKKISSQATLTHGQYLAIGKWGRDSQPSLDGVIQQKDRLAPSPNLYVLIQVELVE